MAVNLYTVNDFERMRPTLSYSLPNTIMEIIGHLETLIIIPPQETYTSTSYDVAKPQQKRHTVMPNRKDRTVVPNRRASTNVNMEDWSLIRNFKPTKMEVVVDGIEKDINDIRISLNKISVKTYEQQKEQIMKHVMHVIGKEAKEPSDGNMSKIAHFVFEVASANKFYGELYADLYQALVEDFGGVFSHILETYVDLFKTNVDSIVYCDPNVDYDGYCKFVKENDKRRALSNFIVMLVNRSVLPVSILIDTVIHFQSVLWNYIDQENKTQECDELSELLFGILSIKSIIKATPSWKEQIVPNIEAFSKLSCKDKTHPSLSSRALFKHLDLKATF